MALTPDTRLAHRQAQGDLEQGRKVGVYEITAKIGEGGMGQVYRARDLKLNRDVALKVLPEAFATDADRLARFTREAQTLASLNHPNIAAIYGLEEADGIKALVMELVEGDDLSQRIARGAIPIDEALPIAKQIAEALEAAHEQGIIHRDLKPANIKVRADGTVKVLDFGLAKAVEGDRGQGIGAGGTPLSQAPTITTPAMMTGVGMILGTAAYMSPEQARGKPVDKRTDIWAFGCVLYEMLTGTRAFPGEDVTETLAAVVKSEPDFTALPATVPSRVRQILALCLRKDPKQRARDIGDLLLALGGEFESPRGHADAAVTPLPSRRLALYLTGAAILGGAVVGIVGWSLRPLAETPEVTRFEYSVPSGVGRIRNSGRSVMAFSPDGRYLAYNTTDGLYIKATADLEARLVLGTAEVLTTPFFSPDSQSLAYITVMGALMRVAVTGGQPVRIADGLAITVGASWSEDDSILIGTPNGVARVPASGGVPETIITVAQGETVYGPQLLPGGGAVLFSVTRGQSWDEGQRSEIVVHSLGTGTRTVVLRGGSDARYLATGHLVYSLRDGLFAVGFDLNRLMTVGSPVSVAQGVVRSSREVTGAANYGISARGTLAYLTTLGYVPARMRWFARGGAAGEDVGPTVNFLAHVALSPDQERVAFGTNSAGTGVRVVDVRRGVTSQVVATGSDPAWSPDGHELAYDDSGRFVRIIPAGGGDARQVFQPPPGESFFVEHWHPAGRHLTGVMAAGGTDRGVVIPLTGDQTPMVFDQAPDLDEPQFSPDGRWIAYNAARNGRDMDVFVVPYPPTGERIQISSGGGVQPEWRGDGRELYYLTPQGTLMTVSVDTSGGRFSAGAPTKLFDTGLAVDPIRDQYAVTRDGSRFLIATDARDGEPSSARFVIVQNWIEELKRLVPTN